MTKDELSQIMDKQFIKGVYGVQNAYKEKGLSAPPYIAIGRLIYGTNASVVKMVIEGKKSIPHLAAIRFVKRYNIDPSFLYDANQEITCTIPEEGEEYIISKVSYPILEQYIAKKIEVLHSRFADTSNIFLEKLEQHWKHFSKTLIVESKGITIDKTIELLAIYFDCLAQAIEDLDTLSIASKHSNVSQDNLLDVYKQRASSLQDILEAKELEISGLKKYANSLEQLVL